jgi:L-lactate dehydrogenase complex protein LldE
MAANSSDSPRISAKSVGLFVTCLADLFRPQVAFAAEKLIQNSGFAVSVPRQSCCGQPAYNSGESLKAIELAKNFISQFESFDYIVAPSGSCAAMVSEHYPSLFEQDDEWAARCAIVCEKTYELSRFLVDIADIRLDQPQQVKPDLGKVTYHDSCSGLRELGIRSQPRKLLGQRLGLEISEMENSEICCGFGGTFCMKYPEISTRMADNKIRGIESAEADILLGGDLGCLMNLAGRLKRNGAATRVYHFAELLAETIPGPGIAESD